MELCTICYRADAAGERTSSGAPLCPACGTLFQWFLDHYTDIEPWERGWIVPETTFHELDIESLDDVQWLVRAEDQFGVMIPERGVEVIRSVRNYLSYIRLHGKGKGGRPVLDDKAPLWDRGLDG